MIEFTAPIRIEPEMNRRDHWSVRKRRFAAQVMALSFAWPKPRYRDYGQDGRITICLTRIAPRRCDDDNAIGGWKAVRDEIARVIGVDDGDGRLTWVYAQEKGSKYAIRVRIEAA